MIPLRLQLVTGLVSGLFFALQADLASAKSNNWLFIGDSHGAGGFGEGLREALLKRDLTSDGRFYQFSVSGSTATHWFSGSLMDLSIDYAYKIPGGPRVFKTGRARPPVKDFASLNDEIRPTTLIIELGTNDTGMYSDIRQRTSGGQSREPASAAEPIPEDLKHDPMGRPLWGLRRLLSVNSKARCALILPPRLTSAQIPSSDQIAFAERMIQEGRKRGCLIVDSRLIMEPHSEPHGSRKNPRWKDCVVRVAGNAPLLPDRGDGIHFTYSKGEYWGQCVASLLAEKWGE